MVGVEQHHEGPIHDPLAFPIGLFDGIAREAQPEALDEAVELIFLRHFFSSLLSSYLIDAGKKSFQKIVSYIYILRLF